MTRFYRSPRKGLTAVSLLPGVDTLTLSASSTGDPDIIALAATVANDGIVTLEPTGGTGTFAVAIANVGTMATIDVTAELMNGVVTGTCCQLRICETTPSTGICLAPPNFRVSFTSAANETRSFAVTATARGIVPFDPANNRIFVKFRDANRVIRGSTSVAVRTQ